MKRKDALWVMQMCRDRDARSEAEIEAFDTAIDALKNESIFSADRPRGEWKYHEENKLDGECCFECSECGRMYDYKMNYCGYCGADMRGENE